MHVHSKISGLVGSRLSTDAHAQVLLVHRTSQVDARLSGINSTLRWVDSSRNVLVSVVTRVSAHLNRSMQRSRSGNSSWIREGVGLVLHNV